MKKGYVKAIGEACNFCQEFGVFVEGIEQPITTHFCSHAGYADMDLACHKASKELDVLYGIRGDVIYMNGEIQQSAKDSFNQAEMGRWLANYGQTAPVNHLAQ